MQHIGDKIAKILDKKTRELYKERGYRDAEIEHFMISCSLEVGLSKSILFPSFYLKFRGRVFKVYFISLVLFEV